jgi:hypothetical protein
VRRLDFAHSHALEGARVVNLITELKEQKPAAGK